MDSAGPAGGNSPVTTATRGLFGARFDLAFDCAILAKGARPVAATGPLAGRQE